VGEAIGFAGFFLWNSRRKIALDNLRNAADRGAIELKHSPFFMILRNFMNLGKFLVEIIKIYYGFGDAIFGKVEIKGEENFRKAAKKGRGIMLITGHCGNWELMAVCLSINVSAVKVVARKQNNHYINRFIERTREKYGNRVIYKEGALKKILTALKNRETVGILMDQSVKRSEGLIIHFLGSNAYAMKTPAIIARKTKTPVLPIFIHRTERGHLIEIGEEVRLSEIEDSDSALLQDTINFSRPIEDYIRTHPEEWLWIHRRWKKIRPQ
jgi:KDO2-lipid IV(A) lauroyltransferase